MFWYVNFINLSMWCFPKSLSDLRVVSLSSCFPAETLRRYLEERCSTSELPEECSCKLVAAICSSVSSGYRDGCCLKQAGFRKLSEVSGDCQSCNASPFESHEPLMRPVEKCGVIGLSLRITKSSTRLSPS